MTTFETWYAHASEPMRIAVITAVIAIIVAIIGAIATAAAGYIQANAGRKAVDAQKRTLFLELIDRRAKWLDNTKILCGNWMLEFGKANESVPSDTAPNTRYYEVGMSVYRRDAQWLFGDDVVAQLAVVEAAVKDYGIKQKRFDEWDTIPPEQQTQIDRMERQLDALVSQDEATKQMDRLSETLHPYLYVGDIKVPDEPKPPALLRALRRLRPIFFKSRQQRDA